MRISNSIHFDTPAALILANGNYPEPEIVRDLAAQADYIVAADGGANWALKCGIVPHVIIGDFDSLSSPLQQAAEFEKIKQIFDNNQETNDLEKALLHCIRAGCSNIYICGATGERIDHSLATLQLAKKYYRKAHIQIITEKAIISILKRGTYNFATVPEQLISLLAFPRAGALTTEGLLYPLNHETLKEGSRGISNSAISARVKIHLESGCLLFIQNFRNQ
jgi:thiamine pyrophosphokinase